ncbi:MAG: hypothetical protein J1F07_05400 [Muribaculaceae bacterium]|nr:hypothetical protein [Muribaculaceae bacterium]
MKSDGNNGNGVPKGARFVFGVFMVLFYIAVGLFFILDPVDFFTPAISYVVGGILCAYGLFRGYRMYRGMN